MQEQDALLAFVRETLNSFAKWDVMTFFHQNPFAAETATNIARFAAREERDVSTALPELVDRGLLLAQPAAGRMIYRLTLEESARDAVARFLSACEDREFRARAIQVVIEHSAQT